MMKPRPWVSLLTRVWLLILSPLAVAGAETTASVGKLRSDADAAMVAGDVDKSIKLLNQVIAMEPLKESNYVKRYRAHQRKRKYREAFADLTKALEINPAYKQALGPRAKLGLQLGRCAEAAADMAALKAVDPKARELRDEASAAECAQALHSAGHLEGRGDLHGAREALGLALALADSSHDLLVRRAALHLKAGDLYECVADAGRAIKLADSDAIDALNLRGQAYYRLGEHEMALNHWRKALKSDPEHPEVKGHYRVLKALEKHHGRGEAAAAEGRHADAVGHWRAAMAADAGHAVYAAATCLKVAKAHMAGREWVAAHDAVQEAINLAGVAGPEHKCEALMAMGEVHLGAEKYDEAVQWYQQAVEARQDHQPAKEGLHKAQIALKQSKEIDFYKVLGVPRTASQKEIKKAYRAGALEHHPDKVAAEDREKAEQEFMKIAQAYEILSDEETRAKYDRGEDVTGNKGNQQQHGGHHGFPFNHFQNRGGGQHHFHFRH